MPNSNNQTGLHIVKGKPKITRIFSHQARSYVVFMAERGKYARGVPAKLQRQLIAEELRVFHRLKQAAPKLAEQVRSGLKEAA